MLNEPEVLKTIKERYSMREYTDRPIEEEKLNMILESGRLAPSASNAQPWNFYVVRDRQIIKQLAEKMPLGSSVVINSFISEAPAVIVATAGPIDLLHKAMAFIVNKKWYYLDLGIALEHMVLCAWELGIGSCWIGWFNEKRIKTMLNIPRDQEVIAMLTLGYPKELINPVKHRKALEKIVKFVD